MPQSGTPLSLCRKYEDMAATALGSNGPHEGPGAASSRTVPLDAVVSRHEGTTESEMELQQVEIGKQYTYFPPKEHADDNRHFPALVEAIAKRVRVRIFMEARRTGLCAR